MSLFCSFSLNRGEGGRLTDPMTRQRDGRHRYRHTGQQRGMSRGRGRVYTERQINKKWTRTEKQTTAQKGTRCWNDTQEWDREQRRYEELEILIFLFDFTY
jgi:hypothetical protein